jgi:aminoglycoside 3-N-acetyltransferase
MLTYRHVAKALNQLGLDCPVIAHASLSSFGDEVRGGADTVIGALLGAFSGLMMPTFTYKTMLTPEVGPDNNGLEYGSARDANLMAEFFSPQMPADAMLGTTSETLRQHPHAHRSMHPILSFAGINVDRALAAQTIAAPLAPIGVLAASRAYVLLVGVNHTVNTSIHYAEKLAGRKQFLRWALTNAGVVACPGWPGTSCGFQKIASHVETFTRRVQVGQAEIQAIPLVELISTAKTLIEADPLALLPDESDGDLRARAVREDVAGKLDHQQDQPVDKIIGLGKD